MRRTAMTASWSILAFTITTIIGYMLTGDWIKGGTIGVLCRAIKIPAYWYHDSLYAKHWPVEPTVEWVPTTHDTHNVERRLNEIAVREHCDAG